MFIKSSKRVYIIGLDEKLANRVIAQCNNMTIGELQSYIDTNFKKAQTLGSKNSGGAWAESKMYRDKAKIAIIEMDDRVK